ncbi:HET domain-containing protein [Fusarium sp. LHS14.1]|nr:HET domain-containing protein [Fusarium sp. LHS14.1]
MQRSLKQCLSSHAECTRTSLPPPSRLVDVQNLRLVDSAPIGSPTWAALSYCWGGPQKAQTTSQNVKARYQAIDFGDMPLTLRDAIRTCRELNLPYLWIDSICIIQDDDNDKAREINKMPQVYQGALITLSASCAATCDEGFLHDRLHPAPAVALPIGGLDGDCNILSSGRALSERIIDYGSQRASYFCNSSGKKHRFGMLPSPTGDLLRGEWANTVEKYSARQLSFASDRLNAVAAVASRFAEAAGLSSSEYVAGLWKPSLIRGLLWTLKSSQKRTEATGGPSFSWASHLMQVAWQPETWGRDTHQETASILEAEVKVGNALLPFGSVASSRITINGPLVHTTLKLSSGEARFHHDGGGEHSMELFLDKEEKIKAKSMSVWLLELLFHFGPENSMGPGSDTRFGLVLRSIGQGQFMRMGIYKEWIPQDIPVANHKLRNDFCKRCKEISDTTVSKVELV